jgi:hypothetical protein
MLTQLATVKTRLAILETDTQYDALLATAIKAASERFDRETNRRLARTENATHEFDAGGAEILPPCYPIESVSKFELKSNEADGWTEQANLEYLIRRTCVISLVSPLAFSPRHSAFPLARVTYNGGYVLPGATPAPGQAALPTVLEQAAVEQVAYWFQNRDRFGLLRMWEYHGTYRHFADLDLLQSVKAVLFQYTRWEY